MYKNNIGLFNVIYTGKYNILLKCNKHYIIYATKFVGGEWALNNNYYHIVLLVGLETISITILNKIL